MITQSREDDYDDFKVVDNKVRIFNENGSNLRNREYAKTSHGARGMMNRRRMN